MRKNLPKWAHELPADQQTELRGWLNPQGYAGRAKPRTKTRRTQDALIAAGLMATDGDLIRLAGKARRMRPE